MKKAWFILLAPALAAAVLFAQAQPEPPASSPAPTAPGVGFGHVDVYLDSGSAPLAAYQVQVTTSAGDVTLVGIEGGEHAAFKEPPYYDPAALGQKRVVLGAFNTGADLPRGRTRVARLMVRVAGDIRPAYVAKVDVATSADAKPMKATISVSEGAEP